MKKRFFALLVTLCMVFTLLPTMASAATVTETAGDNNSVVTAQALTLGDTVNGAITATDDVDFYKLVLAESGQLTLDMTSYMQYYCIYLYDKDAAQLWSTEENESTVGVRADTYAFDLVAGTYYIKITGNRSEFWASRYTSTGNYTFTASFVSANVTEIERNNSAAEANAVTLGSAIRGQIAMNDSYDFYQFTLEEPGCVTLDMTSYMQYYCINLYDIDGTTVWLTEENEYNSTSGFRNDTHNIDLLAGTYYIRITGDRSDFWAYRYTSTGNYTIDTRFTSANVTEIESNNSTAEANTVSLPSTICGQIAANDPYDFYKFALEESKPVIFDMTSYMQYYCIYIYDTDGTQVWYTDSNEYDAAAGYRKDTHTVDLSTGTYYIKVTGAKNSSSSTASTGNYTLLIGAGVTGVTLNTNSLSLTEGEQGTLSAVVSPSDALNPTVTWSSNNNNIATVSDGVVTAVAPGLATITVTTQDGGYTSNCIVAVTAVFADVDTADPDNWYAAPVIWAVKNGITQGATTTTFEPDSICTRAQIVTFLYRAAGEPDVDSQDAAKFIDVDRNDYYAPAVAWAVQNNITVGTTETTFSPDDDCTRAQIVTFLHRYEGTPAASVSNSFTDVAAGEYYAAAVNWAVAKGVTVGTTATTFSPNDGCTRAQIVTFLYRGIVNKT